MCWWVMTMSSRSSTRRPCAASACSSSSSALPELGPESTRVSGSSSMRYVLTRPTAKGVGIGRQWMPAAAALARASAAESGPVSVLTAPMLRRGPRGTGAADRAELWGNGYCCLRAADPLAVSGDLVGPVRAHVVPAAAATDDIAPAVAHVDRVVAGA